MKPRTKDVLMEVYYQLFRLYVDICDECYLGNLDFSKVNWILETIHDLGIYIYEKSNGS